MPRSAKKLQHPCVLCDSRPAVSDDHIPPASFFPADSRFNLYTVRACEQCNQGTKIDEDYFLATLMFSEAGLTQAGKKLWAERVHAMLRKDRGVGAHIAHASEPLLLVNPAGIVERRAHVIRFNNTRLCRVASKVTRGLYFKEFRERLPRSAGVATRYLSRKEDLAHGLSILPDLAPGRRDWPGVFRYFVGRQPDKPTVSLWLLEFFSTHWFVSVTDEAAIDPGG